MNKDNHRIERRVDGLRGWSLSMISPDDRDQFRQAVLVRDTHALLKAMPEALVLKVVARNAEQLRRLGIYEKIVLEAYVMTMEGQGYASDRQMKWLFARADRLRLRAASDALPGRGPYALYRGVDCNGWDCLVRGVLWTPSFEEAKGFASLLQNWDGVAVHRVLAPQDWVLAYFRNGGGSGFLLQIPAKGKVERVWWPGMDKRHAEPAA